VKYRRKPEEVDAMQLTKENRAEVLKWMGDTTRVQPRAWDPVNIMINCLDGRDRMLIVDDYIIKIPGKPPEFEIIPKERFEMDYEKVKGMP
jgi:hypothetical protein